MELKDKEERRDLLFQAIEEVLDEIIDERLKSDGEKINNETNVEQYITKEELDSFAVDVNTVRAIEIREGDFIHLTEDQVDEAKKYMKLEKTEHPYYNYVVIKIYSQK